MIALLLCGLDSRAVLEVDEAVHAIRVDQLDRNLHSHFEILVTADDTAFDAAVEGAHEGSVIGDAADFNVEGLPDPGAQFVGGDFLSSTARETSRGAVGRISEVDVSFLRVDRLQHYLNRVTDVVALTAAHDPSLH